MTIETFKIFSLCENFNEDEFPAEVEAISYDACCDSYVKWKARSSESFLEEHGPDYEKDGYCKVSIRLFELGAVDGEDVLIHIDY